MKTFTREQIVKWQRSESTIILLMGLMTIASSFSPIANGLSPQLGIGIALAALINYFDARCTISFK